MQIRVNSGVLNVDEIPPIPPVEPPVQPQPPVVPVPYFDVGDATGAPGETVDVIVEAGCAHPISGFHIGGGVGLDLAPGAGYGKFKAVGAILGSYLTGYLGAQMGLTDFWRVFQFASWESHKALPEEWWEYHIGFFSIAQEKIAPPVPIPAGTELFTLQIEILPTTSPGEYELTCKDEYYYTHARQRRRDFMYNYSPQGFTKVETFGGKLTVT